MEGNAAACAAASCGGLCASEGVLHQGLEQFCAVSSIFDAAEMVLYVADMETYELLFMNAEGRRIWGDRVGEQCYKVLQSGQLGPCEFCTNAQIVEHGQATHPVIWEFQNTVNKRWYLCLDKAIPWTDGRLVRMELAIDITQRKQHEEFREQYIGLISHDLRSPLLTINLAASTLKLQLERALVPQAVQPLETIRHSTRRMSEMIEDLVETTKLEAGQIQLHESPVDLALLAATVCSELGTRASRAIGCESGGPVLVMADVGRIERVLENLVGNAVRYSPPGSPVWVKVAANDAEAIVTVMDQGAGIAPEIMPRLFQRFYRGETPRSTDGVGLGLYNSRLIVEHHGGRIWVDSTPGVGSTFGFSLPTVAGGHA